MVTFLLVWTLWFGLLKLLNNHLLAPACQVLAEHRGCCPQGALGAVRSGLRTPPVGVIPAGIERRGIWLHLPDPRKATWERWHLRCVLED